MVARGRRQGKVPMSGARGSLFGDKNVPYLARVGSYTWWLNGT